MDSEQIIGINTGHSQQCSIPTLPTLDSQSRGRLPSSRLTVMYTSPRASQMVLVVKNLLANAGDVRDTDSIPGLERSPEEGHVNPLLYTCLDNPHGQRSLESYSPWGHRVSDTTEQLSIAHMYKNSINIFKGP